MNKSMVDIMCCPACKGDLKLSIEAGKGSDIVSGSLYCAHCKVDHRIIEGTPNMRHRIAQYA